MPTFCFSDSLSFGPLTNKGLNKLKYQLELYHLQ